MMKISKRSHRFVFGASIVGAILVSAGLFLCQFVTYTNDIAPPPESAGKTQNPIDEISYKQDMIIDINAPDDIVNLVLSSPNIQGVSINPDGSAHLLIDGDTIDEATQKYIEQAGISADYEFINGPIRLVSLAPASKKFIGGAPYLFGAGYYYYHCSMGFTALSDSGKKVILSAGHCTDGDVRMHGVNPSQQNAVSGSLDWNDVQYDIGNVGVWAFGEYRQTSPDGDSPTCDGEEISILNIKNCRTDFAIWEVDNSAVSWLFSPRVSQWDSAGVLSNDLLSVSVPISTVSDPVEDAWTARSGRTTGWEEGTVSELDIIIKVCADSSCDSLYILPAYQTTADADKGDSGGSFVQRNVDGTYSAVGVLSAADDENTYAIGVKQGLDLIKSKTGQTYRVLVTAPVANLLNVNEGDSASMISGTAEPNSIVTVSPAETATFTKFSVSADASGAWSFNYVSKMGIDKKFTISSKSDYSISEESDVYAVTSQQSTMPLYRFWSELLSSHFYTIDKSEKEHIERTYPQSVWRYEGIAYSVFQASGTDLSPIYRFYSEKLGGHFYTISQIEKEYIQRTYPKAIWQYEGEAFYAYKPGYVSLNQKPVYRFWSPVYSHHFYTAEISERDTVLQLYPSIWQYESIGWLAPL
jgi:hypothetical protein